MGLIPSLFLDAVVAVALPDESGKPRYCATGFLYGELIRQVSPGVGSYQVFLVTNRHVVDGERVAWLRFNPDGEKPAREYRLELYDSQERPLWFQHPDDLIDVAVVRITAQRLKDDGIRFDVFLSDIHVLGRQRAQQAGVTEGDGVFVLGFPLGLVGEQRNYVIVRQGAIARIRDCYAGASKDFLLDCSVFPGNSGGPVVNRPEAMSIQGTEAVNATYLLGVVAGYVPYRDTAISAQTKRPRIIFEENSGLASVFPIDYVADLAKQSKVTLEEQGRELPSLIAAEGEGPQD